MKIKYVGKCLFITGDGGRKTLVVGDMHLGYEEMLNRSGVFIGRLMFKEHIKYFKKVFIEIGKVDEIVLLGDVKHDFGKAGEQEWNNILSLFDYFFENINKKGKIVITRGNHDNFLINVVNKFRRKSEGEIELVDFYILGGVAYTHGNKNNKRMFDRDLKLWVLGHAHPAVKLKEGIKIEKYKCFLVGKYKSKKIIVVPSFFDYVEGSDPRENGLGLAWEFDYANFDVKLVGENLEVFDFGKLKKLK